MLCFAILSIRKHQKNDSEIDNTKNLKTSPKQIEMSSVGEQKALKMNPKIIPKSLKILFRITSRVHPAAPMLLQGGPEIPK